MSGLSGMVLLKGLRLIKNATLRQSNKFQMRSNCLKLAVRNRREDAVAHQLAGSIRLLVLKDPIPIAFMRLSLEPLFRTSDTLEAFVLFVVKPT
jgi:hypothetical protein